jgi:hypothetical protein
MQLYRGQETRACAKDPHSVCTGERRDYLWHGANAGAAQHYSGHHFVNYEFIRLRRTKFDCFTAGNRHRHRKVQFSGQHPTLGDYADRWPFHLGAVIHCIRAFF